MAASAICFLVCAAVFLIPAEGVRKIDVKQQMLHARRSRSLSEITRDRREDVMGLGEGEELKPGREVPTAHGTKKVKFQETFEGVPIVGATVVFEESEDGALTSDVSGHLVGDVDQDVPSVTPRLSADDVFRMVALSNMDKPSAVKFDPERDAELEVMVDETLGETAHARLIYRLSYRVEKRGRISRPSFLVDANTGDVIKKWEGISLQRLSSKASKARRRRDRVQSNFEFEAVGGNEKIGKAPYDGVRYPKLEVTDLGNGTCSLTNNVAKVSHCHNSWDCYLEAQSPFEFNCSAGFTDSINGAYSPLADALYYISATYEMFDTWYGIKDPLRKTPGENSVCGARIHFGEQFENAFWDGYFITFGDGNSTFYPLTSINVVAHEISHGVTEMNSGLYYYGESGGINEAFSDMAGEAVEFFATKNADWMIGYEIFKDPDKALRYFDDPDEDGWSINSFKDYCPGIDVHFSSGVFNRAFYLLGIKEGWDVRKAFAPFVVANVLYWLPDSRFYEAACGVVQAARDLQLDASDVIDAFRAVGIEPCVASGTGILTTSEISVPEGHVIIIHAEVTEDMDVDRMSVVTRGGRMDISVKTPNCDFCSRRTSHRGQIDICDVTPGLYVIELTAREDLVKAGVYITGGVHNIFSNASLASSNDSYSYSFTLPEQLVLDGGQILLRMSTEYGYAASVIRFGQEPNLDSYEFDIYVDSHTPAMLCSLRCGTYYGVVKTWAGVARGISLDRVDIISGKRMDTPPARTRRPTSPPPTTQPPPPATTRPPPPEEEESGSGDEESGESGGGSYYPPRFFQ